MDDHENVQDGPARMTATVRVLGRDHTVTVSIDAPTVPAKYWPAMMDELARGFGLVARKMKEQPEKEAPRADPTLN